MSILTIDISEELKNEVNHLAIEKHLSINELIEEALKKYLLTTKFQEISGRLEKFAKSSGYDTEEAIFRDFS